MPTYQWDPAKNEWLRDQRSITFEEIIAAIEAGGLLDVLAHTNQERYPHQRVLVVSFAGYAWLVPHVEDDQVIFLKTIISSRKATRKYLGGGRMISERQIPDEEYLQTYERDEWQSIANLQEEITHYRRWASDWVSANPVVRVILPKADYEQLQARAIAQGTSCEAVVTELVRRYVKAGATDQL